MKKIVLFPAMLILATIINIACENCKDYKNNYIETTSGDLAIKIVNGYLLNNANYANDTLNIFTRFNNICVAKNNNNNFSLFNQSFAKCKECGSGGSKYKLLNIRVSASNIFNGIAVDSSINNFVKVKWQSNNGTIVLSPLSTYMDTLLNPNYYNRFNCELVIFPKPTNPFNGKIKVTLTQQNALDAIAETVNFT
jgi:hypothetical protein